MFPDNMADIELVCLTWNQFVDCLKGYTDHCFTPQQRRQFNKAVENPIESVHQMCTQRSYQQGMVGVFTSRRCSIFKLWLTPSNAIDGLFLQNILNTLPVSNRR